MSDVGRVVMASVVPPLGPNLEEMAIRYFGVKPLVVGPGIRTGISIKYDNPREVGADRIVNAVAGHHLYGGPLVIVDFGTAITFDAISACGRIPGRRHFARHGNRPGGAHRQNGPASQGRNRRSALGHRKKHGPQHSIRHCLWISRPCPGNRRPHEKRTRGRYEGGRNRRTEPVFQRTNGGFRPDQPRFDPLGSPPDRLSKSMKETTADSPISKIQSGNLRY